jgi:hypothetical protein
MSVKFVGFENEHKHTVNLRANWLNIVDVGGSGGEGEDDCSLKDVATIMYSACGQGVQWLLANELAKRLNVDPARARSAMEEIIEEYFNMSREEAFEKTYGQDKE